MDLFLVILASLALLIWLYLVAGRGWFWLGQERDDRKKAAVPAFWPHVIAVIPARNESETIGETIGSLFRQGYPGELSIILIDDESDDNTGSIAQKAAADCGYANRISVLRGLPLPKGWTGKLWALKQGITEALPQNPDYLLLTDADIVYGPGALAALVARAKAGNYVLTSLMVKLRCESFAEKCFVPAFIFFFQMLYPFSWVNKKESKTAAAAGGCMLIKPNALIAAGNVEAIRGALIDDCTLGAVLKKQGPIWLGLTDRVSSCRPYDRLDDIRRMVARSAYAQLHYSPLLLMGAMIGMTLTYLVPPFVTFAANGPARWIAVLTWLIMALAYQPILRAYKLSPFWGVFLPAIAASYMVFTIDSAYQHWNGRGGLWKGRIQSQANIASEP